MENIISIDLSNFNPRLNGFNNNKAQMFDGCSSLTSLTLNNVSNDVFNAVTTGTSLPTTVTIYRDGNTYVYDSNSNTWIIQ